MGRFRGTRIERLGCRKCYIFRVLMLSLIDRFVRYQNSIIYLRHNTRVTIEILFTSPRRTNRETNTKKERKNKRKMKETII